MFIEKNFEWNGHTIPYLIDFPEGYSPERQYPVLVYLHGYGFVFSDIERLKSECPVRRERIPENLPFVLIAPKCSEINWLFHFETLSAFFDHIADLPFCDRSRFYLCGTSMGAYTSWIVLMAKQNFFAAAVICCGGGPYWGSQFFKDTPIRLVHGGKDPTVLPRESEIMASKINEKGGNVEVIMHENLAHNVWTVTFSDPETYKWLLSHKKA